jgi:hypothetical protein
MSSQAFQSGALTRRTPNGWLFGGRTHPAAGARLEAQFVALTALAIGTTFQVPLERSR